MLAVGVGWGIRGSGFLSVWLRVVRVLLVRGLRAVPSAAIVAWRFLGPAGVVHLPGRGAVVDWWVAIRLAARGLGVLVPRAQVGLLLCL
jgi:hypothetical protein